MITKGIFGAPLKSASLCGSYNEYGLSVPDPVYRCFEEIIKRGLLVEGIFRLSGAAPEVENLLLDFDKPPTYGKYIDLRTYDIHAITGVVKKFLRQLPDPVIPIMCHSEFIEIYDRSFSTKATINALALKIQQLPREHFHLIYYMIMMASLIQKHADINMMNPEALAVVLAPVCTGLEHNLKEIPSWVKRHTRTKMMNDMGQFIETNSKWTQIWTLLIESSDQLLALWKDSLFYTSVGHHTVPCHPSSSATTINSMSHGNGRHSTSLSLHPHQQQQQTELLLDIVPPTKPPTPPHAFIQRRSSHSTSDELYKVVVMRTRQTTCKSLKNRVSSSAVLDRPCCTQLVHSNSTSTVYSTPSSSLTK
ncbi:Rho GTPase activation protein [Mucor mucedo]|nr:Rho GTPase activation protein [Mucor mucedo]KAI7892802.1 Rho GTPase activation protein [Mucor mucedo]